MGDFDCCAQPNGPAERSWSFSLPFTRPPAGLSANDRGGRWVRARSTAAVREMVFYTVRALHIGVLDRCRVDVVWVVADRRRRDTDNLSPFMKAIFDGIGADKGVSAHVVDDDAPEYMIKPGATIRYVKGCTPHFEVTITEVN